MYRNLIILVLIMLIKNGYSQDDTVKKEAEESIELENIYLKPVVQFSCARMATRKEDKLEANLKGSDDTKKLHALKALMTLNAPSSVKLQHDVFLELSEKYLGDDAIILSKKMFDAKYIEKVLFGDLPNDRFSSNSNEFYWAIRAVGVMKLEKLIPRLIELSETQELYTQLAAEKSIEDFDGKTAEDALIKVIGFWKYNAYCHASTAMIKRNPIRLSAELEKMTPPDNCKYFYAITLAKCSNPKSVPILCETVKNYQIIDGDMFNLISKLGTIDHKGIIESLPDNVRPEQKEKALECVKKFNEKLQKDSDK